MRPQFPAGGRCSRWWSARRRRKDHRLAIGGTGLKPGGSRPLRPRWPGLGMPAGGVHVSEQANAGQVIGIV